MDCDSANPQASAKACDKVSANFQKIIGQVPPCVNPCPCVARFPGFSQALNGPFVSCTDQTNPNTTFVYLQTQNNYFPFVVYQPGANTVCGNLATGALSITEEQGLACIDVLRQAAAAAGLVCH